MTAAACIPASTPTASSLRLAADWPNPAGPRTEPIACRLCGHAAPPVATQTLLRHYEVSFHRCLQCDLIQTQEPYWLEEAYGEALSALDTGAVQRSQMSAQLVSALAWVLKVRWESPCLDYGGGHGVMVRMMRDAGYDFRLFDRYAQNLFARGFEADPARRFALVTAFEVLEHFASSGDELDLLFAGRPDFLLAGTFLHQGHRPRWWYYSLESGQHVAFYSSRTMLWIGDRYGYRAIATRRYTLFVRRDVPIASWRLSLARLLLKRSQAHRNSRLVPLLLAAASRPAARTWSDHVALRDGTTRR